jgi:hypothetical protein
MVKVEYEGSKILPLDKKIKAKTEKILQFLSYSE